MASNWYAEKMAGLSGRRRLAPLQYRQVQGERVLGGGSPGCHDRLHCANRKYWPTLFCCTVPPVVNDRLHWTGTSGMRSTTLWRVPPVASDRLHCSMAMPVLRYEQFAFLRSRATGSIVTDLASHS
jgi:hypothetical protein